LANHVHLVLVPSDTDGLRRALAAVHRRYAASFMRDAAVPGIYAASNRASAERNHGPGRMRAIAGN
jgi:hypothetical protein